MVGPDVDEWPRDMILTCAHTILGNESFRAGDAARPMTIPSNPLVQLIPTIDATSLSLGSETLCIDLVPGIDGSGRGRHALLRQIVTQMECRRKALHLAEIIAEDKQTEPQPHH